MVTAIALDTGVLAIFSALKVKSDALIVGISAATIVAAFTFERIYLARWTEPVRTQL